MKRKIIMGLVMVFLLCAFPAQAEQKLEEFNCFDAYKFGSIDVDITGMSDFVPAGSTMHLSAKIQNKNDYPIVDGSVYVKVFQKQGNQLEENIDFSVEVPDENFLTQGDPVVDQFFALENITLDKNETKTLEFDWKVPSYLPSGQYRLANYFQSGHKFNLSGLSFTEDVIGSDMHFKVENDELTDGVSFDKNNVRVDGDPYNFVGFLKAFPDKDLSVEATLVNSMEQEQKVTITRDLYYWDSLDATNKIKSEEETVMLAAKESKSLSYTISKNTYPVNYYIITARYGDAKSILNLRYTKEDNAGQESARINFPAVKAFPLLANQPVEVFTCAHAVKNREFLGEPQLKNADGTPIIPGQNDKSNSKAYNLILNVQDENGQVMESFSYTGDITGEMMGLRSTFQPKKDYNKFKLETILKDETGQVIDQAVMDYDCQKINASYCRQESQASLTDKPTRKILSGVIVIIILLVISLGAIIYHYRMKKNGINSVIFFLIFSAALFSGTSSAQAKTVQPEVTDFNGRAFYKSISVLVGVDYWWTFLSNPSATVTYITTNTLGEVDNKLISPGKTFTITDKTFTTPNSIKWNLTGYSVDSPTGYWRKDAALTTNINEEENDLIYDFHGYKLYTPLVFAPPEIEMVSSGSVSCNQLTGKRVWNCTVSPSAQDGDLISVNVGYKATSGKWYSHSFVYDEETSYKRVVDDTIKRSVSCRDFDSNYDTEFNCYGEYHSCGATLDALGGGDYNLSSCCKSCNELTPRLQPAAVTYNYIVSGGTNQLDPPTCNGPDSLVVNEVGDFKCDTDPAGGVVARYQIDWNGDGAAPYEPSTFFDLGIPYPTQRSWPVAGIKTYKARVCDLADNCSPWSSDYKVSVKEISELNQFPSVNCPASGITLDINEERQFNFRGTDAEGNAIKYFIDWNNNGSVIDAADESSANYLPSGTVYTSEAHSWPYAGTKTFKAYACDGPNSCSWSPDCSVEVKTCTYTCGGNRCDAAHCGQTLHRYCRKEFSSCGSYDVVAQTKCNGGAGCESDVCDECPDPSSGDDKWIEVSP